MMHEKACGYSGPRRAWRRWWPALLFAIAASAALTVAWAQTTAANEPFTWDFALWGSNPLMMIAAVAFFVDLAREEFTWLRGKLVVLVAAVVIGAVLGLLVQSLGLLLVAPFVTMSWPAGGFAYGAACGVSTVVGVNLVDLIAQRATKARLEAQREERVDANGS